jgi:hypothetical protein
MTDKIEAHKTGLKLDQPVPESVPVASDIRLKAEVICPSGCDLQGGVVHVLAGEEILATNTLVAISGAPARSETEEFSVKAPRKVGSFSWRLVFPGQEIGGKLHGPVSLPISFATKALAASLAVWDVPSPVTIGRPFKVKVGVKSSGASALKGAAVELLDDTGEIKGAGRLGDSPWAGTSALYWTEIEVSAPGKEGPTCWSARFADTECDLPHDQGQAEFSFVAVRPPDHKLTILIVDQETAAPIENAHVRLGYFRAVTSTSGLAEVSVPDGHYELKAWMTAHELSPATMQVDVAEDMTLRLEAVPVPEEDPSAMWSM